jgi:hypothetical protein
MKFRKFLPVLAVLVIIMACINRNDSAGNGIPDSVSAGSFKLELAFPQLQFDMPVELVSPDDGTDRLFVVGQKGVIHVFPNKPDVKSSTVFLDISSQVRSGGEMGLLGLAFHPDYKRNGYFYVNYTKGNPLETIVSRFKVRASNPQQADPQSEQVVLRFGQPFSNHNGGKVAFGNDGYLYISAGDGGSGGDPGNRAQNKSEYLGKILRINVDKADAGMNYSIPADNPFANNQEGFRKEIFAYGLRNVWRFNFDRQTGLLWAGDVGQNKIEEVDIIEKGGNYGWKIMEANECFRSQNCDKTGLVLPIWSYEQGFSTGRSITGGYICYDKNLPALSGKYIYGDYVTGNVWALTHADKKAVKNELIATIDGGLSSFGEDTKNNLYLLAYGPGKIYKLSSR